MSVPGLAIVTVLALGQTSPAPAVTQAHRVFARWAAANTQKELAEHYLRALRSADYQAAFSLLSQNERAYYQDNVANYASGYKADAFRLTTYRFVGMRSGGLLGRVYFIRESATFRDHAREIEMKVTATVPLGVVAEHDGYRIADPGHPWRAFACAASAQANGMRITVKKVSFFTHRIELVVTFQNSALRPITVLAYGKSVLRNVAGQPYALVVTRDWNLTDKTLFEGLRLASNARYTGAMTFASNGRVSQPAFALTVAPLLEDGGNLPFSIEVDGITPGPTIHSQ